MTGQRDNWLEERRRQEHILATQRIRRSSFGPRPSARIYRPIQFAARLLRLTGLYALGHRNAESIRVTEHRLRRPDLPTAFDGYTIVFLSDLHVGNHPRILARAADLVRSLDFQLAVLGGDYQTEALPPSREAAAALAPLIGNLRAADGILAVLGNHDSAAMVPALESLGMRVLINEWTCVERSGQCLHLLGLDDVHAFHSSAADAAVGAEHPGFRIGIVHTPDYAPRLAEAGFSLTLSGHTHGGQIALPGGWPLLTALDAHRRLAAGWWRVGAMDGYTSSGLGVGIPAIRFNTRGEIALIRLERGS